MNIRVRIIVLVAALVVVSATHSHAQGIAFAVFNGPYSDAELHRLDLATGDLAPVGMVGHRATHIAFDSSGALYGVDSGPDQLITIDVMNGSGTVVGPFGVVTTVVRGLTFTDDGRLWMTGREEIRGPSLYEINPATGEATWHANLTEDTFGSLAGSGDTLFLARASLTEMDISTGVTTPFPASQFKIWSARAIDFDDLGRLWSLMLCGVCMGPADVLTVRTIDRTTGTIEGDGPYEPHGTWGLAILRGGLFLDGFESGTTSAWAVVQ